VSTHPLVSLSADVEVRRAAGFRAVAAEMSGESLGVAFHREVEGAPRRHAAGRKYLTAYNSRLAAGRRPARDSEHLALALVEHCRRSGTGLALPEDAGNVDFVHACLPVKAGSGEAAPGEAAGRTPAPIDLLGLGRDERMVVARVRYAAPSAARTGVGETPLRALLEGLASGAVAWANRAELGREVAEKVGRSFGEAPPLVLVIGTPRYWQLCRRREAQKGAAWIQQLERLAVELGEEIGVGVLYLSCELPGDPGWSYPAGTPVLDAQPRLTRAWEHGAGRVRPKAKPRSKPAAPQEVNVSADPSRPIRPYSFHESYRAGDRIEHPQLGTGVVQGPAGRGKITVRFGEKKAVLVHQRRAPGGSGLDAAPSAVE
jgi:hypothetical protein